MNRLTPTEKASAAALVTGPFLLKLAKHLALLSCLMIAGTATGRTSIGSFGIGLMVVAASLAHLLGRTLQRRQALVRLAKPGR